MRRILDSPQDDNWFLDSKLQREFLKNWMTSDFRDCKVNRWKKNSRTRSEKKRNKKDEKIYKKSRLY